MSDENIADRKVTRFKPIRRLGKIIKKIFISEEEKEEEESQEELERKRRQGEEIW